MLICSENFDNVKDARKYINELRDNPGKFHPVTDHRYSDGCYLFKYAELWTSSKQNDPAAHVRVHISTGMSNASGFECDCGDGTNLYSKDNEHEILLGWLPADEIDELLK